ncbi:ATP-dependent Clp protease adaptor ClpS [Breoghania sp.]|uniref:ATP-dependent Clp protease adaptor ClpS n=1 Tax=Breoghania sp. TaxID=2065378 RepID=UPI0026395D8C|nr:ATP-dependent Clp protease adaptor ClpS [Breoghania sp.]MDJ0932603.1 ATP-dependent Clp protease adaptor ClpS [Breoghania sp.]
MADPDLEPKKKARPKMYKVILINDDYYTPREFVVMVLEAKFGRNEAAAEAVMMTAHQKGTCVVAVYQKDVAETKATRAVDMAKGFGFPLMFTTEPEE